MNEIDKEILNGITEENIYTEINRLEGRLDFLTYCYDIPGDIREREKMNAMIQMHILRTKLIEYCRNKKEYRHG